MKLFSLSALLMLTSTTAVLAQPTVPGGNDAFGNASFSAFELIRKDIFDVMTNSVKNTQKYNLVMGSLKNVPGKGYFTQSWLPGTLKKADGTTRFSSGMRFNLALQAIEIRDSAAANNVGVITPQEITQFGLGPANQTSSHFFEVQTYQTSEESGARGIFEALTVGGELRFFLLHKIVRVPAPAAKGIGEIRTDTYVREVQFYVLRPGQSKLIEFQVGRKKVLKLFGDRAQAVQEYATSKNFSYDKHQDVVWMADYYNKLVAAGK